MPRLALFVVLASVGVAPSPAANPPVAALLRQVPAAQDPVLQAPAPKPLDPTTLAALERLSGLLQQERANRDRARAANDAAAVAAADARQRELAWQFAGLVSRLDVQEFEAPRQRDFDLKQELEQLVRPLVETLKDATEEPRRIAELKGRIDVLQQRQTVAEQAQRAVEQTRAAIPAGSPALAEIDRELRDRWRPAITTLQDEIVVLRARLLAREGAQTSLASGLGNAAKNFLQSSGVSVALAVLVFAAVFFGLRFLLERLLRRRAPERGLSLRIVEVSLQAMSLVLAIAATLVVPWMRNDWLLLAVCIVFLIGAGWVLIRMLPQFFEQVRLVLNVGAVREGERLLVDGLPFRVDALRLYSRLVNPDLQGGHLRVPIQHLIGKRSRRSGDGEPWFPCRQGDVVALADGVVGEVRAQTPDVVVVESFGAPRSYPTLDFLRQNPRNLSAGFTVTTTFGIDHQHRSDALTVVAGRMHEALATGLATETASGELLGLRVDFQAASANALEFVAIARFAGSAAPRYFELQRRLQSLLLATCNANGWSPPSSQMVVRTDVLRTDKER